MGCDEADSPTGVESEDYKKIEKEISSVAPVIDQTIRDNPNWKGNWSADSVYQPGDIVYDQSNLYKAMDPRQGIEPQRGGWAQSTTDGNWYYQGDLFGDNAGISRYANSFVDRADSLFSSGFESSSSISSEVIALDYSGAYPTYTVSGLPDLASDYSWGGDLLLQNAAPVHSIGYVSHSNRLWICTKSEGCAGSDLAGASLLEQSDWAVLRGDKIDSLNLHTKTWYLPLSFDSLQATNNYLWFKVLIELANVLKQVDPSPLLLELGVGGMVADPSQIDTLILPSRFTLKGRGAANSQIHLGDNLSGFMFDLESQTTVQDLSLWGAFTNRAMLSLNQADEVVLDEVYISGYYTILSAMQSDFHIYNSKFLIHDFESSVPLSINGIVANASSALLNTFEIEFDLTTSLSSISYSFIQSQNSGIQLEGVAVLGQAPDYSVNASLSDIQVQTSILSGVLAISNSSVLNVSDSFIQEFSLDASASCSNTQNLLGTFYDADCL
jgi:hypothetical protein